VLPYQGGRKTGGCAKQKFILWSDDNCRQNWRTWYTKWYV